MSGTKARFLRRLSRGTSAKVGSHGRPLTPREKRNRGQPAQTGKARMPQIIEVL